MESNTASARTAGLLYLVVAVTGGFSMLYIPSLIVPGAVAQTVGNIVAHESLFRLGILSGLVCQIAFLFLGLAFYRLFREVNHTHARVMVALVMAAVPVAFVNMLNQLAALRVATGADYLAAFQHAQLNALTMLFLDVHTLGLLVVELFWGLWLVPLALLVIRSGFMPRFLGVLLLIAFCGYCADFLTRLLLPSVAAIVTPIAGVTKFGELAMILWLLVAGANTRPTAVKIAT